MLDKADMEFYRKATLNVLEQINSLGMNPEDTEKAKNLASLFRSAFKLNVVKKRTFHEPEIAAAKSIYDSLGFCRISSVVFMTAMGLADWDLMFIGEEDWYGKKPHHYLRYRPTGKILDLTYDQFAHKNLKIPYENGHIANDQIYTTIMSDGKDFAKVVGLDIIELLKQNSMRGK